MAMVITSLGVLGMRLGIRVWRLKLKYGMDVRKGKCWHFEIRLKAKFGEGEKSYSKHTQREQRNCDLSRAVINDMDCFMGFRRNIGSGVLRFLEFYTLSIAV
jgi:hypothetical protein